MKAADAAESRMLVQRVLSGSRHASRALELLDMASTGADAECMALVLADGDQSPLTGVVMCGLVAGAGGVMKVHAIVGVDAADIVMLVDGLLLQPHVRAARMIVCEIADDESCAEATAALLARAFMREGCVEDFFADGVNLDLLVRRLSQGP